MTSSAAKPPRAVMEVALPEKTSGFVLLFTQKNELAELLQQPGLILTDGPTLLDLWDDKDDKKSTLVDYVKDPKTDRLLFLAVIRPVTKNNEVFACAQTAGMLVEAMQFATKASLPTFRSCLGLMANLAQFLYTEYSKQVKGVA